MAMARLNAKQFKHFADPEINTRIAQYEMTYRMQTSVPTWSICRRNPPPRWKNVRSRREEARFVAYNCCWPGAWRSGTCVSPLYHADGTSTTRCPSASRTMGDTDQPSAALVRISSRRTAR